MTFKPIPLLSTEYNRLKKLSSEELLDELVNDIKDQRVNDEWISAWGYY